MLSHIMICDCKQILILKVRYKALEKQTVQLHNSVHTTPNINSLSQTLPHNKHQSPVKKTPSSAIQRRLTHSAAPRKSQLSLSQHTTPRNTSNQDRQMKHQHVFSYQQLPPSELSSKYK